MRSTSAHVLASRSVLSLILAFLTPTLAFTHPGWRQAGPEGGDIQWVAVDPANSNTVYVATTGSVWKSTDAGLHWTPSSKDLNGYDLTMVAVDPARPSELYASAGQGVFASRDAGGAWRATDGSLDLSDATGVTVDPQNLGIVYSANYSGVFKSTDWGASWSNASAQGEISGGRILIVDPAQPNAVYVACANNGIFKTTNGGATWTPIITGLTNMNVRGLALAGNTLYAATGGGIFKSANGGGNWALVYSGSGFTNTRSVAALHSAPNVVYAGNVTGGVARSTDGGANWTVAACGPAQNYVNSLVVHEQNPQIVYAGTRNGFYASTDGGATFNRRDTGLRGPDILSSAVDDQNALTYYVGTEHQGIWKTTDGGQTWIPATPNVADSIVYSMVKVPGSNILYASIWENGLHKSTDGGATWVRVGEELIPRYISGVALSPVTARLFVTGEGVVSYSTDGGATWKAGTGVGNTTDLHLALDPVDGQVAYVGTYEKGMFKTTDGGDTWAEIGSFQQKRIRAVMVDPSDANIVYAGTDGLMYRSTDKGGAWSESNPGLNHGGVKAFANGPAGTVFAGTWSGRVYRTQDRGESWSELLPRAPVTVPIGAISSDAANGVLLIGAEGAGLFKGEYKAERTVYFPQVADGVAGALRFRTTIILANGGDNTQATIAFKTSTGQPLALSLNGSPAQSVHTVNLARLQSVSLQTPGTAGLQVGYATLTSGWQVGGTVVFTLFNNTVALYEAGVPATPPMYDCSILFDRSEAGRDVGVALVSAADTADATVTFRLFNESNELLVTRQISALLPKFGAGYHVALYATEIFPEIMTLGVTRGVVTVDSSEPIAPVTLRQTDNASLPFPQEVPTMCVFPVVNSRTETSLARATSGYVYFPQIANGRLGSVSLDTTLVLLTTGRTQTNVRIEFITSNGVPLALPLRDLGVKSVINVTLQRGRPYQIRTTGEGSVQAGYVRVNGPLDLSGTAVFTYTDNGMRLFEAGVPAALPLRRQSIYMDNLEASRDIGFAAVNTSTSASQVTLRLYDNAATLKVTRQLTDFGDPMEHLARYASELFPEIKQQNITGGIITVESTQDLSAVTLRQHAATQAFPNDIYLLTIFPVIPLFP